MDDFFILNFCKNQKKRLFFSKEKKEERFKDKYLAPVITNYRGMKVTKKQKRRHTFTIKKVLFKPFLQRFGMKNA